eukprot:747424-Hanusia_phi.AAC.3
MFDQNIHIPNGQEFLTTGEILEVRGAEGIKNDIANEACIPANKKINDGPESGHDLQSVKLQNEQNKERSRRDRKTTKQNRKIRSYESIVLLFFSPDAEMTPPWLSQARTPCVHPLAK